MKNIRMHNTYPSIVIDCNFMKIYYNLNAQYNAYSEMQNDKTIAQL